VICFALFFFFFARHFSLTNFIFASSLAKKTSIPCYPQEIHGGRFTKTPRTTRFPWLPLFRYPMCLTPSGKRKTSNKEVSEKNPIPNSHSNNNQQQHPSSSSSSNHRTIFPTGVVPAIPLRSSLPWRSRSRQSAPCCVASWSLSCAFTSPPHYFITRDRPLRLPTFAPASCIFSL